MFRQKFQIVSDVHIEKLSALKKTIKDVISPCAKILIVAGDLGHTENEEKYRDACKELCSMFEQVILVPGNHEYYSSTSKTIQKTTEFLLGLQFESETTNLTVLIDSDIVVEGIFIFGSVFWSYCPQQHYKMLPLYNDKGLLTAGDFNNLHLESVRKLEESIQHAARNNWEMLVVTHYAPSFEGTFAKKHVSSTGPKGDPKNYMYCSSSDHFIENKNILSWVYGHTGHNGIIGKLVSNQIDISSGIRDAVLTVRTSNPILPSVSMKNQYLKDMRIEKKKPVNMQIVLPV